MSGANGRLKLGLNGKWVDVEIGIVGFGHNYYVRLHTPNGTIDLAGQRHNLSFALRAAADIVDGSPPSALVASSAPGAPAPVTKDPTPAEVLDYFRQSPDLASMAGDVETALADLIYQDQAGQDVEIVLAGFSLDDLIDDGGRPVYGCQARIAKVLGITNAGSYRPRILAVIAELGRRRTTTTANKPQNTCKSA